MIDWYQKPYWVMGVVNVTPDSFSDGGLFLPHDAALRHVEVLVNDGADIIDIGAESTRPQSAPVSEQVELDRIVPVLEGIKQITDKPISLDSSSPRVMVEAIKLGVSLLNDVRSFQRLGAETVVADYPDTSICLMHSLGEPATMQDDPRYDDVVVEVESFLLARVERLSLSPERVLLDPGFGFGKSFEHNLTLFKAIPRLASLGFPLMVGVSRKRMIGQMTGQDRPSDRMVGSVVAAVEAVRLGAKVVRVHDVAATVQALTVSKSLRE